MKLLLIAFAALVVVGSGIRLAAHPEDAAVRAQSDSDVDVVESDEPESDPRLAATAILDRGPMR